MLICRSGERERRDNGSCLVFLCINEKLLYPALLLIILHGAGMNRVGEILPCRFRGEGAPHGVALSKIILMFADDLGYLL